MCRTSGRALENIIRRIPRFGRPPTKFFYIFFHFIFRTRKYLFLRPHFPNLRLKIECKKTRVRTRNWILYSRKSIRRRRTPTRVPYRRSECRSAIISTNTAAEEFLFKFRLRRKTVSIPGSNSLILRCKPATNYARKQYTLFAPFINLCLNTYTAGAIRPFSRESFRYSQIRCKLHRNDRVSYA